MDLSLRERRGEGEGVETQKLCVKQGRVLLLRTLAAFFSLYFTVFFFAVVAGNGNHSRRITHAVVGGFGG